MCRWSVFFQIIWLQCTQNSDSMCLCTHKLCLLRASSSGICECACVTAASLLISSLPRGLLCFSAFFFFFCFFFCGWKSSRLSQLPGLWLTIAHSQDASVPATHRGAMGALQESCSSGLLSSMLSNSPLLCSLLVTLHYVVVSKGDSGEDPKRKYWTCLKIDCSYVVISDNNTNCPFTARIF